MSREEILKIKLDYKKTLLQLLWVAMLGSVTGTISEFKTTGEVTIIVFWGTVVVFVLFSCIAYLLISYLHILKKI